MAATRDDIISLADMFLRTRGYNAFSYRDIGGIMDIRNAAIHYYFPSKADLAIAVIGKELDAIKVQRVEWGWLSPEEQLARIIGTFFRLRQKGKICLTGSLTPDYDTFPRSLQDKVQDMCSLILDWMGECLDNGRQTGHFHFSGEPADKALLVMSCLLSSLLLSRVLGKEVFDRMIDQQLMDLGCKIRMAHISNL
jgi:AcrR family transcriptional regulator